MAKICEDAYWFAILYGYCADKNYSVSNLALLLDNRGRPSGLARGTGRPPRSTQTSVVSVIQQTAQLRSSALRNAVIYTTETPTEMDLGMARRCGIKEINTTGNGTLRWHKIALDSHDGAGQSLSLNGDYANAPWITNRKNRTGWINPASFNSYKSDLNDYYDNDYDDPDVKRLRGLTLHRGGPPSLTFSVPAEGKNLGVSTLGLSDSERHMLFLATAHQMVARVWGHRQNDDANRKSKAYVGWNIGALLVDATGDNILAWGVNTNKANTTRHGEVNLIQYFESTLGQLPLPQNATFYTTLEPCQMCSGMLASVGRANGLKVIWGQSDVAITQSALQRNTLGIGSAGPATKFGVHGWAEIMAMRHTETAERMRVEAQKVVDTIGKKKGHLPQKEFNALKEAKSYLAGLKRYGSVQTTEFLRQVEAKLFFDRARARRQMSGVMRELTDIRETLEGLGGTLKPSSVKGVQDVATFIPDLLVDQAPMLATHRKLDTFVSKVGGLMKRV